MRVVERGVSVQGVNRTVRDSREAPGFLRDCKNIRLRDQKIERRPGYEQYYPVTDAIKGQQLMKQTPVIELKSAQDPLSGVGVGDEFQFGDFLRVPSSYGLIRWHDDFQPKTTRDWTVEFGLTLGEEEPIFPGRLSYNASYGSGATNRIALRNVSGNFIFDQTILANDLTFYDGVANRTLNPNTGPSAVVDDAFAISALAIAYGTAQLEVTCTLIESGVYYPYEVKLSYGWGTYTPGDHYHVAVIHNSSGRTIKLFVDGVERGSYTYAAGRKFAGEEEDLNGRTEIRKRDIVLLNECTVRGSYSSNCKLARYSPGNQKFHHYKGVNTEYGFTAPPGNIYWFSPPRGTGMNNLRIWHEDRTESISNYMIVELPTPYPANLKGYWKLNDGSGTLFDKVGTKHGSVHSTYPQYVADDDLLHNIGIQFSDNQYLIRSYQRDQYKGILDSHRVLIDTMQGENAPTVTGIAWSTLSGAAQISALNDFTIQIQFRTPYTFQQEMAYNNAYPAKLLSWPTGTRNRPGDAGSTGGNEPTAYALRDGSINTNLIHGWDGTSASPQDFLYHPDMDQTLWSIEGSGILEDSDANNYASRRRLPLARGLLDPDGHVIFEFFADGDDGSTTNQGRYLRLRSSSPLSEDTVKTITFKKTTVFNPAVGGSLQSEKGFVLEILDETGASLGTMIKDPLASGGATDGDADCYSRAVAHEADYDVIIGSSYVNDLHHRCISDPRNDTVTGKAGTPYPVAGRHRSGMQDACGFFRLGFFRMWSRSLEINELVQNATRSLKDRTDDTALLFNLEPENPTGRFVYNNAKYALAFELGYKSWGVPEPDGTGGITRFNTTTGEADGFDSATWAGEDCLGYGPLPSGFKRDGAVGAVCRGIGSYNAALTRNFGLTAVFDDMMLFDSLLQGSLSTRYVQRAGLLNEFIPSTRRFFSSLGDRTFITSKGAVPKSFNGSIVNELGFQEYRGPRMLATTSSSGGSLIDNTWFGIRVVYYAEQYGIFHVSPRIVIRTPSGASNANRIYVSNIPPHPDSRVSSIRIYVTTGEATRDLASNAPVRYLASYANLYHRSIQITDVTGIGTDALDSQVFPVPAAAYSVAALGRLWLAGDPTFPDTVYFSKSGNPEKFDTISDQIVIEGNGDRINGLLAIFGSVFVFSPNAIHRIDEVAVGSFIPTKVSDIGPASDSSLAVISIASTGRTAIAFWSNFGPYLFDGVRLQNIGYPVRKGHTRAYDWLDPTSVVVLNDVNEEELIFFYKSKDSAGSVASLYDSAVLYNYRNASWKFDDCLSINESFADTVSVNAENPEIEGDADAESVPDLEGSMLLTLVGSRNGMLYKWGQGDYDGATPGQAATGTVLSYSSGVITIDASIWTTDTLFGLWATVYDTDNGNYFCLPIISNTANTVTLDTSFAAVGFTPAAGHLVYPSRPVAYFETPWDVLDSPVFEKTVNEIMFWISQDWRFKVSLDWADATSPEWTVVAADSGKRVRSHENFQCESIKLEMQSVELSSRVDQYAYQVEDASEVARASQ